MEARQIKTTDVPTFLERAQSRNYVGGSNLCDFYDDTSIEELTTEIANADDNTLFFVEEYEGEIVGYKNAEMLPEFYYLPIEIQRLYKLPTNKYKICYVWSTCSFSRWSEIYHLGVKKVGDELWYDFIRFVATENANDYTIVFNNSTPEAESHHRSHNMISSKEWGRIISRFLDKNRKNPYEALDLEEYDEGEMNLFTIVKGYMIH